MKTKYNLSLALTLCFTHTFLRIIAFEPEYIFPIAQLLSVAVDDKERAEKTKEAKETQMVR